MDDGFSAPLTKLQGKHGGKVWAVLACLKKAECSIQLNLKNVSNHYGLDVLYVIVNINVAEQSHYSFNGNGSIFLSILFYYQNKKDCLIMLGKYFSDSIKKL